MFNCIEDSVIRWDLFRNEQLCEKFPPNEWKLMVSDISSNDEWRKFIAHNQELVRCYILRTCANKEDIAFVYLYNEKGIFDVVSIHGGGWGRSMRLSLLYYRGLILMIETLLSQGKKVRTSCFIDNKRAFRFLRGIGFVPYCYTQTAIHMWINEKKLIQSPIYKHLRLHNKESL